jgi:hypothetical protein
VKKKIIRKQSVSQNKEGRNEEKNKNIKMIKDINYQ